MEKKIKIDRLSELPDNLLCSDILPHLSLRDAIASSSLSRRWRFLWTQIPHLYFSSNFFRYDMPRIPRNFFYDALNYTAEMSNENITSVRYIEGVIWGILSRHSVPLESLRFDLLFPAGEVNFDKWIQLAALKGVKQMGLNNFYGEMLVPPSLFACRLLTNLNLGYFTFTQFPTDFGGFLLLKNCFLSGIHNLTDDRLEQLIALCPLLQKLVLAECTELISLKICASNLNHFILKSLSAVSVTADCPRLAEFEVEDCDSLSKLQLNSSVFLQHLQTSKMHSHENMSTVISLKRLSLRKKSRASNPPFLTFLGSFPDLEELEVAAILIQDTAAGQMVPGHYLAAGTVISDLVFPNLKKAYVDVSSEMGDKVVALVGFLLRNAPLLKTMTLDLAQCPPNVNDWHFINQVLDLNSLNADAEIIILEEQ